jgi:hypothetical protein
VLGAENMAAAAVTVLRKRNEDERVATPRTAGSGGDSAKLREAAGTAAQAPASESKDRGISCKKCDGALPHQEYVREVYNLPQCQILVALVIVANFVVSMVEKEIDPYPEELQFYHPTWFALDQIFTWTFLLELFVNMYGSWFCAFWRSGWNVFDFVIVLISVLSSTGTLTGPLKMLKTLRAFRVFRLFKRIESLNKIITSLIKAIPGMWELPGPSNPVPSASSPCAPLRCRSGGAQETSPKPHLNPPPLPCCPATGVMNAFIIMIIIMAIFAIIGVSEFGAFGQPLDGQFAVDGSFTTWQTMRLQEGSIVTVNSTISAETLRGFYYGQEYFGTFSRAMFTLFQARSGPSLVSN